MGQASDRPGGGRTPALEWTAAGVGLALTALLLGHLLWQAVTAGAAGPPDLVVRVDAVTPAAQGWVVEVTVENRSATPAAAVEVEGVVRGAGPDGETAVGRAVFDHVPGHSEQKGGLVLARDPAAGELSVRATGYADP